jgi:hypothetical protein
LILSASGVTGVSDQFPPASATAVPSDTGPRPSSVKTSTAAPGTAAPTIVGAAVPVTPSASEVPVSAVGSSPAMTGAAVAS